MGKYCVYVHVNKINGKIYVGRTCKKPEYRWGKGGRGYEKHSYFWSEVELYGWDNFYHEVVAEGLTKEKATFIEWFIITVFNTTHRDKGYNSKTGKAPDGIETYNKECRNKISVAMTGKVFSDEHKKKMSIAMTGKVLSEEHKNKISKAMTGLYTGAKNPYSKKVICDGKVYSCLKEFLDTHNLKQPTVSHWLTGYSKMPIEWAERGLRYYTEEE